MGRGNHRGALVKLRFVRRFKDRHGVERCYLRAPGKPAVALPVPVGSPEFMRAYSAAIAELGLGDAAAPAIGHSFHELARRYWASPRYLVKSPRTRHVERLILRRFLDDHGTKDARGMKVRHVDAIMATMADRPAAAMDLLKKLRQLFRLAIKLGWRDDDPTATADRFKLGTWHTWTEDEIAAFHGRWPRGTTQRAAFDLLLFTGQRSGDVRVMTWADARDGRVKVLMQAKTGTFVSIRQHPDLTATLAAHDRKGVVILINQIGKPFSEHGFGNWMADAIDAAGLPDRCVAHGLRKAAARRLAEAGCTAHEIKAITGHKSLKEVERYSADAERARLADSAMAKVAGTIGEAQATNRGANFLQSEGKSDA